MTVGDAIKVMRENESRKSVEGTRCRFMPSLERTVDEEALVKSWAEYMKAHGYDLKPDYRLSKENLCQFVEQTYGVSLTTLTAMEAILNICYSNRKPLGPFNQEQK